MKHMKNFSESSVLPEQPALTERMEQQPQELPKSDIRSSALSGKVAIITGGDSGIGRAVAYLYAQQGMKIVIVHYDEQEDAKKTEAQIVALGGSCLSIMGDIRDKAFCNKVIEDTMAAFGAIDVLVNNAAVQYSQDSIIAISQEQLEQTFAVNVFGLIYLCQAALPHMKRGANIINTASIVAFKGNKDLLDYSGTKGAIVAITKSLAMQVAAQGIRVNAVAPGPIWTPLIPASFDDEHIADFGKDTFLERKGQPYEVAPSYLFLILEENSYMTGQVLHPNGGF
jgi:NAD(P)-dependent dehydrogenase (short-subunit alcohol dehydrogenase family)